MISAIPYVTANDRSPIVVKVRERLNIPGDSQLDENLMVVLRGVQRANGIEAHGELDDRTLDVLSLSMW